MEAVYQEALAVEFEMRNIPFQREAALPVFYKKRQLQTVYRADFVCFENVIVELKALRKLSGLEESQLINYLKVTSFPLGLLLNFGSKSLEYQRRANTRAKKICAICAICGLKMRFIIREQAYEKPIMAGEYRYERDGQPTGAVEKWRLTAAADGFQFLRVDLDARAAASGHTYLYHALVNPAGQVERLKYRFWTREASSGLQVAGDVVFEENFVTATRTVNGEEFEQVLDLPQGFGFWFPSMAGLHFAGDRYGRKTAVSTGSRQAVSTSSKQAVTLNGKVGGEDTLMVQLVEFNYGPLITDFLEMTTAGKERQYSPWKLSWGEGNWRIIKRDAETGWPLGMDRDDGLTAVAGQYIRYE